MGLQFKYEVTTAPTWWPISLEEAKAHLRVSHTSEDAIIWDMVRSATEMVERETWTQINQKGITIYLDLWESLRADGVTPIQTVDSIKYYDENNEIQTLPSADFKTDLKADPIKIDIEDTPTLFDRYNAVEIALTVGYSEPCKVPAGLSACVKMVLADLYENRQNFSPVAVHELPRGTQNLLWLYSRKAFV